MSYVLLIISVIVICSAHLIRTFRWKLFIQIYEKPDNKSLLQSLSFGFLLNFIVPLKLGDLFRIFYAGKKMKNGKVFAFSTVILDRYLDIIVVGLLFALFLITGTENDNLADATRFYMTFTGIMLLCTVLIYGCRGYVKKILKGMCGIFNEYIEISLLKLCWSLIWNFKDIFMRISKIKLIISTGIMWLLYLLSYYLFAESLSVAGISVNWLDVYNMMFAKSSLEIGTFGLKLSSDGLSKMFPYYLSFYLCAPIFILFIGSFFIKKSNEENIQDSDQTYLNLLPQLDKDERLKFLEEYFSDERKEYINYYLKVNQNISIINDYSAGSNATTMLCMNSDGTFFRKYAFGIDGEKLYEQIKWLQQHCKELPLPPILRYEKGEEYCYYDMPYQSNPVGLFNYAHSMPINNAWNIILKATKALETTVYTKNIRKADTQTIKKYIEEKVDKNIKKILEAKYIKRLNEFEEIYINGVSYKNLTYYLPELTFERLYEIFKNDIYSDIHGDLTIENIICTRDMRGIDDFYIIDPNTGNLHESSNLDYGKILQSIHGGYEFLMSTKKIEVERNYINFVFTKSEAYTNLHKKLREYMSMEFSYEKVRSIYFHEIIHWLRLMPYKIEKDGKRALLFYAGMMIVMNDVIKMFRGEEGL